LRRHGFSSALAFEPEPENFGMLRVNAVANGLDHAVRGFRVGLSDHAGFAELLAVHEARQVDAEVSNHARHARRGGHGRRRRGRPALDVEGHELDVLTGATTLLERSVPM
jgi:FkbM family methyltransferase